MKAITVKQPWASLIVEGIKDIENRTWKTNFRGSVLIHSGITCAGSVSKLLTNPQFDSICPKLVDNLLYFNSPNIPFGAIIGSVEIVDCVINHPSIWAEKTMQFEIIDELSCDCEQGKIIYNWVLANPIKFDKPIPCKGKQSFWEYTGTLPIL